MLIGLRRSLVRHISSMTNPVAAPVVADVDPTQYRDNRIADVMEIRKSGREPYPHKWPISNTIGEIVEKFGASLENGERVEGVEVVLAGRAKSKRESGKNMVFYDMYQDSVKIQVMSVAQDWDEAQSGLSFVDAHHQVKRGDIIGVRGVIGKSKRGELSIFPHEVRLLSTCFHMLPIDRFGLRDQEVRYRQRYLDLILNDSTKVTFQTRAKVINYIRNYLDTRGFVEVETPMMNMIPGGAAARPFETYHNDLKQKLFMRIAPELYLKMLVIGGMEKVYEIGKNFRNEGIDMTHNPEFTAIEFYQAYTDYEELMTLTEHLVSEMVLALKGSYKIPYHADGPEKPPMEIDFTPPWPRYSFVEEIEKQTGETLPRDFETDEAVAFLDDLCIRHRVQCSAPRTATRLLDKLCGHFIEERIFNPAFITEQPQIMSPLAKWHRSKPGLTERFEAFVLKREICNAYTELNDPIRQRACFEEQAKAKAAGDDEACGVDEDFLKALEYGLPPTGGWGLGIDRLVMFLTDNQNIKEVILFPAMKPEDM
jgi:lysyl-tRNA synthetase, class II